MNTERKIELQRPHYTVEDWKEWEGQWELIWGSVWAMTPAPKRIHQRVSLALARLLEDSMAECGKCEVCQTINYKISKDTVLQPDIAVICDDKSDFTYLTFPPKIVVEILSPSTATKDLNVKTIIYAAEGIPYYLIVHPDEEWVRVLKLENGEWVIAFEGKEGGFTFDLGHCQVQADFGRIWHN